MPEADLRAYHDRKRPMVLWTLALGVPAAAATALISPFLAVALIFGLGCGLANALLSMRSNERLADHQSAQLFVLSSTLRIAVFGIVPVVFAVRGPGIGGLAAYFTGFFSPLALYTLIVARALRTS